MITEHFLYKINFPLLSGFSSIIQLLSDHDFSWLQDLVKNFILLYFSQLYFIFFHKVQNDHF